MQREAQRASHTIVFFLGCAPTQDVDEARVPECFSGTKEIKMCICIYVCVCLCRFEHKYGVKCLLHVRRAALPALFIMFRSNFVCNKDRRRL